MTNQEKFLRAFESGETMHRVGGVYGRILRTEDENPVMLTEDPHRKVIMVMGPSGLQQLLGLTGLQALDKIGYTDRYVERNLSRGKKFKLAVFDRPASLRVATWRVSIEVVAEAYPEFAALFHRVLPELKETPIEEFEKMAEHSFYEASVNGPSDCRFMTPDRLRQSNQTASDVRRFLFHTLHFSELYTGDGYTLTAGGKRGVREYLMPNTRIDSLQNCRIIDLKVTKHY
jgi:hypothetical protein